jgi:hypothetical protein
MASDADTSTPLPRELLNSTAAPRSVRTAIVLLWTSWTIAVTVLLFYLIGSRSRTTGASILLVFAVLYNGFFFWLIRSISRKRKWPRYFLLMVLPLSWAVLAFRHDHYFSGDIPTRRLVLVLVQVTLPTIALCLLLIGSARRWSQTASNNRWRGP